MTFLQTKACCRLKQLTPYLISFLVFLVLSISIYKYLLATQKDRDLIVLHIIQSNIQTLLLKDLETALNSANFDKTFFLLKKFTVATKEKVQEEQEQLSPIRVNPYAIYIQTVNGKLVFDLQGFKEILAKLLPSYINYRISINTATIASSASGRNSLQVFKVQERYQIDKSSALFIDVGIDQESAYYRENLNKLYKYFGITIIGLGLIILLALYSYLRIRQKIASKINELEEQLFETDKMNKALLLNRKIDQQLKKLFIYKATEL